MCESVRVDMSVRVRTPNPIGASDSRGAQGLDLTSVWAVWTERGPVCLCAGSLVATEEAVSHSLSIVVRPPDPKAFPSATHALGLM